MRYGITRLVGSPPGLFEISEDRYKALGRVKTKLRVCLSVEEKLDLVLESYYEYEEELLRLALRHLLFRRLEIEDMRLQTQAIGRRLANVLSATRAYLDQLPRDLRALYGSASPQSASVERWRAQEYEREFAYRFMEALRNHMQHCSMPLRRLAYSSDVQTRAERTAFRYRICPEIPLCVLREDASFKTAVIAELGQAENVQVSPLLRRYLEGVCSVHEQLRKSLQPDIAKWDELWLTARTEASTALPDARGEFAIVVERPDQTWVESSYIPEHFVTHRKVLVQKNSCFTNLAHRFVSSEADEAPA